MSVHTVEVTSAFELTPAQTQKIESVFSAKHKGEKTEFVYKIDKQLIGGILVVDGDVYYDGTMRSQIDKLGTDFRVRERNLASASPAKRKKKQPSYPSNEADLSDGATANDIASNTDAELHATVDGYKPAFDVRHAGSVEFCGDGVIMCSGLAYAEYGEMLELENGAQAIVLSLSEAGVGAIVLDDDETVTARMTVKTTGRIVSVPVGKKLLGRVIDPLGRPIDGRGEIACRKYRPIEADAPAIMDRDKVCVPLQTGIIAVDSMIPIGRGQRELIIGDRQTGKTSIAVDTVLNQKGKNVVCVYVAIGQKTSTVAEIVKTFTDFGAMEYTVVVCATARDSAPLQYIAPYAGCAIAEEFMYSGKDVLVIYDDLSKHAVAYRQMSLLLKRPPGREAYPGDIFYLHSRLLERAAKLHAKLGGGSMTALPIVETLAGDISAYVPTNIISITDGQIYLESELFHSGIRPAVNVGLSVSRVGGSAQTKAMRKVSGKLRLDLSQYRELAAFAQFGAELDGSSSARLEQGRRTTEMIKQDVHCPMDVVHQVILLYLVTKELISRVPIERIAEFKDGFIKYFDIEFADVMTELRTSGDISMETGLLIEEAVNSYLLYFLRGEK